MTGPTFESLLPDALTRAERLPTLPAVAVEVLRLCEDDASTVKDLAAAVQRDPALVVKMLKLANSSLFNLGHAVTTLDHAAMVLGMKTVRLMSLSFSLAQALPKDGSSGFDYAGYWRRSLVAAVSARALAARAAEPWQDEAFFAGLLSHVGQLVLAECAPDLYLDVAASQAPRWPTIEVEEQVLGFHSGDVAAALIASWGLPDAIGIPVSFASRLGEIPEEVAEEPRRLAELLSLALRVEAVVCDEENGAALLALEDQAARIAGMDPGEIEAFLVSLEDGIREAADMLAIEVPDAEAVVDVLARARESIVDLGLDAALDLQSAECRLGHLEIQNRALTEKAETDKLTGLHNRGAFDEYLEARVLQRRGGSVPRALGLIMLDVDRFKRFNDTYGHQAGDAVLAAIGRVLRENTRKSDFLARYGGEEFAIVLPQITPTYLRMVAARIRAAIEREVVEFDGAELRVTASLGAVCVSRTESARDAALLVKVADKLLYRAKQGGRNRAEVYTRTRIAPHALEDE